MHALNFTLNSNGITRLHDALLCLTKFNEVVSLEARFNQLTISALNSSKSAYASFIFERSSFEKYKYTSTWSVRNKEARDEESRFTCQLYNKALLSVFKGRLGDARDKDTAVERSEVSLQDQLDKPECRLIVKMICRHGVTKTYKLTYESIKIDQALFNKDAAKNNWKIGAHVLRSFIDYFGANTEQLDMCAEAGRVTFTSYTEKVANGAEVLKHPLETSITLDTLDFEEFSVDDNFHIAVNVKDFKAIVMHAETLKSSIQAQYSIPTRPMQLSYHEDSMHCEFTLMTIGDYRSSSATPTPVSRRNLPTAPIGQRQSQQSSRQVTRNEDLHVNDAARNRVMPPPAQPASRSFTGDPSMRSNSRSVEQGHASQRRSRPSPPPPKASVDPESLFLPADDDEPWDERNFEDEEDTLGWDASVDNNVTLPQDFYKPSNPTRNNSLPVWPDDMLERVAPTQRISDIPTLFDNDS